MILCHEVKTLWLHRGLWSYYLRRRVILTGLRIHHSEKILNRQRCSTLILILVQRSMAMPEYFRIKVGDNGKTFVVDEEGNPVPPERHRQIATQITQTVDEDAY